MANSYEDKTVWGSSYTFLRGQPGSDFSTNVPGNILKEIDYNKQKVDQMDAVRSTEVNLNARDVLHRLQTRVNNVIYGKKAPVAEPVQREDSAPEPKSPTVPSFNK